MQPIDNTQHTAIQQVAAIPKLGEFVSKLVEEANYRAVKQRRRREIEIEEDYDAARPSTPRPRACSLSRARFEDPEVVVVNTPPGTAEMERRLLRGLSRSTQDLQ